MPPYQDFSQVNRPTNIPPTWPAWRPPQPDIFGNFPAVDSNNVPLPPQVRPLPPIAGQQLGQSMGLDPNGQAYPQPPFVRPPSPINGGQLGQSMGLNQNGSNPFLPQQTNVAPPPGPGWQNPAMNAPTLPASPPPQSAAWQNPGMNGQLATPFSDAATVGMGATLPGSQTTRPQFPIAPPSAPGGFPQPSSQNGTIYPARDVQQTNDALRRYLGGQSTAVASMVGNAAAGPMAGMGGSFASPPSPSLPPGMAVPTSMFPNAPANWSPPGYYRDRDNGMFMPNTGDPATDSRLQRAQTMPRAADLFPFTPGEATGSTVFSPDALHRQLGFNHDMQDVSANAALNLARSTDPAAQALHDYLQGRSISDRSRVLASGALPTADIAAVGQYGNPLRPGSTGTAQRELDQRQQRLNFDVSQDRVRDQIAAGVISQGGTAQDVQEAMQAYDTSHPAPGSPPAGQMPPGSPGAVPAASSPTPPVSQLHRTLDQHLRSALTAAGAQLPPEPTGPGRGQRPLLTLPAATSTPMANDAITNFVSNLSSNGLLTRQSLPEIMGYMTQRFGAAPVNTWYSQRVGGGLRGLGASLYGAPIEATPTEMALQQFNAVANQPDANGRSANVGIGPRYQELQTGNARLRRWLGL